MPFTAEQRLERLTASLSGTPRVQGKESRAERRLRMNRPANILVGVLLHAAARLGEGLPLTDLEQSLIDRVGKLVPAKELPLFGKAYREACANGPIAILPEAITSLPLETGYTKADLAAAMPALVKEVTAQPNVRIIDVSEIDDSSRIDTEEFTAALAEYGRGITILTAPPLPEVSQAPLSARVRMHKMYCVDNSKEVGKDEVYWAVSAGSDTTSKTSFKTAEFGSVRSESWYTFPYTYRSETYLFNGTVDQYLTAEIQCWEADDSDGGFYNDLRDALKDFAEWAVGTSTNLNEAGDDHAQKSAGWAAWLAIGTGLLNAILGWLTNDDDLVCERSFGFSRAALIKLSNRTNGEDSWRFDGGGGGDHWLYLRTAID
ncbi:hypothetical protein [Streptomyces sp. A1136]|uniref:hypothetical protein n=1 Tax=Streptomyces sp. A1136 TaxID=2563102 RepID=UPI00109E921C|nr:hypothetical protein [Streptomyces sp. A1136]THA47115.1 hypothetical protein E6R62_32180 [Streptomyces sp. A1136]